MRSRTRPRTTDPRSGSIVPAAPPTRTGLAPVYRKPMESGSSVTWARLVAVARVDGFAAAASVGPGGENARTVHERCAGLPAGCPFADARTRNACAARARPVYDLGDVQGA